MAILASALTTAARVKTRIGTSESTWDALLAELINAATEFIEGELGRNLKSATYTNQLYDIEAGQRLLILRQWPVASVSSIQYRAGSISTPSWTTLQTDDWEIVGDGRQGAIRLYISLKDTNAIRVTYVAGYGIDFSTPANHTLPYELIDLCERLVVRAFKRRESEGKTTEGASAGGNTSWLEGLNADDRKMLTRHTRAAFC